MLPLILKLIIIFVPMITGLIIFFRLEGKDRIFSRLMIAAVLVSLICAGMLNSFIDKKGTSLTYTIDVLPPLGLALRLDLISFYMTLLFTFLGVIILWYSMKYMEKKEGNNSFFGYMLITLGGCYGVALSGNFFTFFLFFEFMSIIYFMLLVHNQTERSLRAGFKFLYMAIFSGVALFISLVIIYYETGSVAFGNGGLLEEGSTLIMWAFISFIIAFGVKTALFPLHFWMPDAYACAPLPAAILSSAIMLKTGAYGFLRVFGDIFGLGFWEGVSWNYYLLVLACFTILFGSLIAISQDDIIRRLAYSGIAQMGYVLLGMSLLSEMSMIGATFHFFAHAFMKGTLFLCAGVIIKGTGIRLISEMSGVGYRYPLTMFCFALASLTAVGIPPFNVFISKWYLFVGFMEQTMLIPIIILLISSFLNACYYFPIVINAFWKWRSLEGEGQEEKEAEADDLAAATSTVSSSPIQVTKGLLFEFSGHMLVPTIILTGGSVIFNLMSFNWPLELIKAGLQNLL